MAWRWLALAAVLSTSPGWAAGGGSAPADAGRRLVVGLSLPFRFSPVIDAGLRGAQRAAESLGVELVVTDAGWNVQKHAQDLAGLVARQVDGIVLWPPLIHSEWLLPVLDAAASAGIPVAIANTPIAWDKALVFVTEDNAYSGRQVASFLVERLHGKGTILEIEGPPPFAPERKRAFEEVLARSGVEIVARADCWVARPRARWATARLLAHHPRFDGVVALSDEMMLGVIDALRDAGIRPSSKVLVSLDYVPAALRLIQTGDVAATFDPRFDRHTGQALEILVAHLRGHVTPPERIVRLKGALGVLACAQEAMTLPSHAIDSHKLCRSDWTEQRRFAFISMCTGSRPATEAPEASQAWCMCYQAEIERRHSWIWVTDGQTLTEDEAEQDRAAQRACRK